MATNQPCLSVFRWLANVATLGSSTVPTASTAAAFFGSKVTEVAPHHTVLLQTFDKVFIQRFTHFPLVDHLWFKMREAICIHIGQDAWVDDWWLGLSGSVFCFLFWESHVTLPYAIWVISSESTLGCKILLRKNLTQRTLGQDGRFQHICDKHSIFQDGWWA